MCRHRHRLLHSSKIIIHGYTNLGTWDKSPDITDPILPELKTREKWKQPARKVPYDLARSEDLQDDFQNPEELEDMEVEEIGVTENVETRQEIAGAQRKKQEELITRQRARDRKQAEMRPNQPRMPVTPPISHQDREAIEKFLRVIQDKFQRKKSKTT